MPETENSKEKEPVIVEYKDPENPELGYKVIPLSDYILREREQLIVDFGD